VGTVAHIVDNAEGALVRDTRPSSPIDGTRTFVDPELEGLLAAVARATGRTPNVRDLTRFDNVYGLDRDAHESGPDALLFTARLLDEHGAPVVRGVVLDCWTPAMVGGQGDLVPEVDFYHDHRGLLFRCALAYARNLPLALHGHTGVGKTELVRYFACLLGAPVHRMNLHGLSTTDDVIGKLLPADNGGVVFQDGQVTTAVRSGGILLLEEMNATGQEVWFALHGLLDGSRALVLVEKNNELVRQHRWCRIFSTFNPSEYPNLYPGTKELSAAYLRRWASVRIPFADLEVERTIILTRLPEFGLPERRDTLETMIEVAQVARKLLDDRSRAFDFVMSTGVLVAWADLSLLVGPLEAARIAFYDILEQRTKAVFRDQIFAYVTDWDVSQLDDGR
jgi:MoxR-like ATPase